MVGILGFTVAQVVDRYLIKSAFNAHDQYARLSLVVLTFVGIAIGIRDRVNVRIELIAHLASNETSRRVAVVLDLVTVAIALLLTFVSHRMLEIGASQPILGTPFTYEAMYLAQLCGMGLLVLFLGLRFVDRVSAGKLRLDTVSESEHDHRP